MTKMLRLKKPRTITRSVLAMKPNFGVNILTKSAPRVVCIWLISVATFSSQPSLAATSQKTDSTVTAQIRPARRPRIGGGWYYAALFSLLSLIGCGVPARQMPTVAVPAAASAPVPQPARPTAPARAMVLPNLQGPWEFTFRPTTPLGTQVPLSNLAELNLQQSDGSLSASSSSQQLFMLSDNPGAYYLLGSACLGFEKGNVAGTISDDGLSFSLTIFGDNPQVQPPTTQETVQTTGTVNSDGTLTGSYTGSIPGLAGCPFNTSGTFSGAKTAKFGGTYTGTFPTGAGPMETLSLTLTENSDSTLNVTGMDNAAPFTTTGYVIGSLIETTADIGINESWVGYLPPSTATMQVWSNVTGDQGLLEVQQ